MLLDTCVLLWLAADAPRLTAAARQSLRTRRGGLFVSAITAFEIGIKHRRKALTLPLPPEEWYAAALAFHGLREIAVDGAIAARSTQLPPLHADPCDRIIVATAQIRGLAILTPDPLMTAYPGVAFSW